MIINNKQNIIQVKDLHYNRGARVIFDGISLAIPRGKITAIMGPSGTGKTTLLRLMAGLVQPDKGVISIKGEDIASLKRSKLYNLRKSMGMLFQSNALFTGLNVFENVAFPIKEHTSLPASMVHDLVLMKLHAVGLRGAKDLMPRELSGGMARRVALARAIALDPEIIMYDEPFTGQDPIAMGVIVKLIRLLNDALNLTSVIVSHDIQETASIADYIYVIANGKLIGQGQPEQLFNTNDAQLKQFVCGLPDGPVPFHYPAKDFKVELMGES